MDTIRRVSMLDLRLGTISSFSGKMGITSAEIPKSNASNKVTREIQRLRGIHSLSKMLNSDHLVLVQYPLPFNSFDYKLLHKTLIRHNAKSVFLIHDLISVQGLASNVSVERELDLLKKADFIIAHNDSMASFLKNNGLANRISVINFFDYRVDKIPPSRHKSSNIIFAGNLAKSPFLKRISELGELKWHVYGAGMQPSQFSKSVTFHGAVDSGILPSKMVDGWGLVWDGDSINGINGTSGEYLRLNSPHKASLYLASGVPLIVWRGSALADVVLKLGLGIAVDNLLQIESMVNSLLPSQLDQIYHNARIFSKKVQNGEMLKEALQKLPVIF